VCPPGPFDGRLDKRFWAGTPETDLFVDILGDPPAHPVPPFATRAMLRWDDQALYVAARLEEPHLWATLTEHDSIVYHDNDFEAFLSPTGDSHDYYELEVNALGTVFDLHLARPYKDGGPADHGWNCRGLRVGIHLEGTLNDPRDTDRGWSLELAIPWASLDRHARADRPAGRPPRAGDAWRLNFSRVQWDLDVVKDAKSGVAYRKRPDTPEHNWVWSPQGIVDMHRPEMWGELVFVDERDAGQVALADSRDWTAYDWLHAVYYAQRRFHRVLRRWAGSLTELRSGIAGSDIVPIAPAPPPGYTGEVQLDAAAGWIAFARPVAGGPGLCIRGDARVQPAPPVTI